MNIDKNKCFLGFFFFGVFFLFVCLFFFFFLFSLKIACVTVNLYPQSGYNDVADSGAFPLLCWKCPACLPDTLISRRQSWAFQKNSWPLKKPEYYFIVSPDSTIIFSSYLFLWTLHRQKSLQYCAVSHKVICLQKSDCPNTWITGLHYVT